VTRAPWEVGVEPRSQPDAPEKSLERQIRAFHQVRLLAEIDERIAGSPGEREAAVRVEAWMREIGFDEVAPAAVASRARPGAVLALHCGVAALGCVVGGVPGFALAALAALSLRREQDVESRGLSRLLPAPDSILVSARAGALRPRRRVILSASLDAPQAGRLFASPLAARVLGRSSEAPITAPAGLAAWLVRALGAAALATAASALGADGVPLRGVLLGLAAGLGLAALAGVEWARASASPGANANASAIAAMLTCGEQLLAQLRDDEELWLVAAGANEPGACGLRSFLDAGGADFAAGALFVHFDRVGGSLLRRVRAEVGLQRLVHPPRLAELARRVAESGAFGDVAPVDWVGRTGAAVAAARDLHVLVLVSLDEDGRPRCEARSSDLPEALDLGTVVRAADFAAAVVVASLRGESDPLAIV
jgi:hypothetical protein